MSVQRSEVDRAERSYLKSVEEVAEPNPLEFSRGVALEQREAIESTFTQAREALSSVLPHIATLRAFNGKEGTVLSIDYTPELRDHERKLDAYRLIARSITSIIADLPQDWRVIAGYRDGVDRPHPEKLDANGLEFTGSERLLIGKSPQLLATYKLHP